MKWDEVIGQQAAKARLRAMIAEGRVPHALMLCGSTGYGTLSLAMAFASALLCERSGARTATPAVPSLFGGDGGGGTSLFGSDETPREEPATGEKTCEGCGTCRQCVMLRHWQHPDLHFSFPTVKPATQDRPPVSDDYMAEWHEAMEHEGPYLSIDEWLARMKTTTQQAIITANESDALAKKLSLASAQGGYKVAIVWLAERMNAESANKILKTLEEPTPGTVFILAVEKPELLLDTIRSRVQRIDVPRIASGDMAAALTARRGIAPTAARRLARAADGNWTAALVMLAPDSEYAEFLDSFKRIMRDVYKRDVRDMKKWSDDIATMGREKQKRLLAYYMRMVREAFVSNFHEPELSYMTEAEEQFVERFGRFINEANVIDINALLELAMRDISQNTNQKIVFFDTALRLTVLLLRK